MKGSNLHKVTSALEAQPGPWSQSPDEASHCPLLGCSALAVNWGPSCPPARRGMKELHEAWSATLKPQEALACFLVSFLLDLAI